MLEMLLVCSAIILVVMGLRLLFRRKVSGLLVYSLWLPAAAGLLLAPVVYLLAGAFSDLAAFAINNAPVIYLTGLLWLAGAAALTTWLILTGQEIRKNLRKNAVSFSCPESPVPVWISPDITTPCLFGLIHPAIYLTPDVVADPERCRHVLAHELTHLRHADHIWSFVRRLCLCVYWFHPLVWLAVQMSKQDSELACDEGALKRLGDGQRLAYGKTVVELAAGASSRASILQSSVTAKELPARNTAGKKCVTATAGVCLLLAGVLLVMGSCLFMCVRHHEENLAAEPSGLPSLSVMGLPTRTRYVTGQILDPQGLALKLTYEDGTTCEVTEGFTCSPTVLDVSGKQNITVTYDNMTTAFSVTVVDVKKMGKCGPKLEWILTTEYDLIIEGSGPMDGYGAYNAPWCDYLERIRSVSLPEGLASIGSFAFSGCHKLVGLKIPDSVTQIGEGAFFYCTGLTAIVIPEGVKVIRRATFEECSSLQKVTLPTGLKTIEMYAFGQCVVLSEVNVSDTVAKIQYGAFADCYCLPEYMDK